MTASAAPSLEEARRRLKELGYLDGRVERFLFRRAFEGRGGLLLPAALLGSLAAALCALAAVAAAEPAFTESPAAGAALFAHVFFADLLPALLATILLGACADRARDPGRSALAAALGAAAGVFLLWIAGTYDLARDLTASALLWAAPVSAAALFLARNVRSGFLARAFARSRSLPSRPRERILFAAAVAGVLCAVGIFASRRSPEAVAAPRPVPRRGSVVVVAVDGLELDATPAEIATGLRALFARGATGWWRAHPASPPETWTDLATGEPASRHGVRALQRVRPKGSPLAFRAPLATGWYFRGLGPRLALVSSAPVSARDRRALAFWEVAASAGLPTVAVGWWASEEWPGARVASNEEVVRDASDGVAVDRQAIAIFERDRAGGPAVQTVYLPGPDIARNDAARRSVAAAEVHRFLEDEVSRAAPRGDALIVLAGDSHPTERALGRMIVYDAVPAPTTVEIRPEDVAPSVLARAGVPVSRALSGRPAAALFRPGSLDAGTVETYGPRVEPPVGRSARTDREYLEKLRALGYLQ